MNGQHPLLQEAIYAGARLKSARLLAAFSASCLLHAAIVALPYLGASRDLIQPAGQTASSAPRILSATLLTPKPAEATTIPSQLKGTVEFPAPQNATPATDNRQTQAPGTGINLLPIPAPTYYTTDELTKRPQPLVLAELDTLETKPLVASGTLILKLWINDQGNVADVQIEKSNLPETFSRAAISAFKNSSFTPGERNNMRVGTVMRIEISYEDSRLLPP